MEIKKIIFPGKDDYYLKNVIEKKVDGVALQCGSVTLSKGQVLDFKTLDFNEIAYLVRGKLKVFTKDGDVQIMKVGDVIYLHKDEVRKTETIENSNLLFFLFKRD